LLTTAAVAASVAGLTVIQPLTAAPPLLLAALLMDGDSGDIDGVGGIADAIQNKLLPSDGRDVVVNFLTGPFGIWNSLDSERPEDMIPSTTMGVASSMPFLNQQGWNVAPPALPPLAPGVAPVIPPGEVAPGTVLPFDLPSLQIGDAVVTTPPAGPFVPPRDVVTSYSYDLLHYAPVSLLNPVALTNSVAAYLNGALSPVKVNPDGSVTCYFGVSCSADDLELTTERIDGVLYVTFKNPDGTLVRAKIETRNGVTYVTYDDDGSLPLVRPLRDYFGLFGNELADVLEPALTALVYWGYRDATEGSNGGLLPTPAETIKAVLDFLVGVKEGVESLFVGHTPAAADDAQAQARATDEPETGEPVTDDTESGRDPKPSTPAEDSDEPRDEDVPPVSDDVTDDEGPAEETPDGDEPTDQEPVDEPVDEEPVDEEPVDEEPVDETPDTAEPDADDTETPDAGDDNASDADDNGGYSAGNDDQDTEKDAAADPGS
jgi:hypothetical protein